MSELPHCPKCGTPLSQDAPAGLCPKCLVQAGFESERTPEAPASPGTGAVQPTLKSPAGSGNAFQPPSPEKMVPLFPQLEIIELLGKGGMGAVYKARQRGLDRLVAVKILPPEIGDDPAFAERFTREARALARLGHSRIVSVYDFGLAGNLFYIVMEYVDGVNLRQTIQAGGLTPQAALAIVPQICEALQFAHDEGIVHRDIKPENILIDKKGRVKIADFGLAKLLGQESQDHSLTMTHQVMGTLRYMAPEQMQGSRELDHRADIYSLGVIFYELLTGELPIGKFAPPSKKVQVDVRLDEIVLRALEQDPEQRYQHASEVKTDVESVSRSGARAAAVVAHGAGAPAAQSGRRVSQSLQTAAAADANHDGARALVRAPAIALIVTGAIHCTLFAAVLVTLLVMLASGTILFNSREHREGPPHAQIRDVLERGTIAASRPMTVGPVALADNAMAAFPILRNGLLAQGEPAKPPAQASPRWLIIAASDSILAITPFLGALASQRWLIIAALTFVALLGSLIAGVVMIFGGRRMLRLESYRWAMAAGIVALVPCSPVSLFGAVFGIWALIVLNRPSVVAAFQTSEASRAAPATEPRNGSANSQSLPLFLDQTLRLINRTAEGLWLLSAAALFAGIVFLGFNWSLSRGGELFYRDWRKWLDFGAVHLVFGVVVVLAGFLLRKRLARLPLVILLFLFMLCVPAAATVILTETAWETVKRGGLGAPWAGVPLGIWTIYLLFRHDVRAAFDGRECLTHEFKPWAVPAFVSLLLGISTVFVAAWVGKPGNGSVGRIPEPEARPLDRAGNDLDLVQGRWQVESQEMGGQGVADNVLLEWIEFSGGRMRQRWKHTGERDVNIRLNAFTEPKRIDLDDDSRGIYRLDGESLTLCIGLGTDVRPSAFSAKAGEPFVLTNCRRASAALPAPAGDAPSLEQLFTLKGHTGWVYNVRFSPDGTRVASASHDGTAKVWDAMTGEELLTCRGHTNYVHGLAYSPDGTRLATTSEDGSIRIWNADTGEQILTGSGGHPRGASNLAFSPNGERIASACVDDKIKVWDSKTGDAIFTLESDSSHFFDVACSRDGKWIAGAGMDGTVWLWDASTAREADVHRQATIQTTAVAFDRASQRLAALDARGDFRVWGVPSGELLAHIKPDGDARPSITLSPDGKWIAAGGMDGTVSLWESSSGRQRLAIKAHPRLIKSVVFSPDGSRLASASDDKTVKIWEVIQPGGRIDLLALVSPAELQKYPGSWRIEPGKLVCEAGPMASNAPIPLPSAPDEYDLEAVVERTSGDYGINLGMGAQGRLFYVGLDAPEPDVPARWSGLGNVDGKDVTDSQNPTRIAGPQLGNGKKHALRCQIRKGGIAAMLDDQPLFNYTGGYDRIFGSKRDSGEAFFIFAHGLSRFVVHRLTLTPVPRPATTDQAP